MNPAARTCRLNPFSRATEFGKSERIADDTRETMRLLAKASETGDAIQARSPGSRGRGRISWTTGGGSPCRPRCSEAASSLPGSRSDVELDHVAVGNGMVAPDVLSVEGRFAPDTRVLERLREVLVHEPRDVLDGLAAVQDE